MSYHRELILNLFDVGSLIDQRLIENLDRLEQLDKIAHWYEGFNPLPHLVDLAEHQLKQCIEAAALSQFSEDEFEGFRFQWRQLSSEEQRNFLCELAGLPFPNRNRDFDA